MTRHQCRTCGKDCRTSSKLSKHELIHLELRSHRCEQCRRFFTKSDLATHVLVHAGKNQYRCNICGKCFKQRYIFKQHMSVHAEVPESTLDTTNPFLISEPSSGIKEECMEIELEPVLDQIPLSTVKEEDHQDEDPGNAFEFCSIKEERVDKFVDADIENELPASVIWIKKERNLQEKNIGLGEGENVIPTGNLDEERKPGATDSNPEVIHSKASSPALVCLPTLEPYKKSTTGNTCHTCGKECTTPSELTKHELTHLEMKSNRCENCRRYFTKSDLAQHLLIHMGKNEHMCKTCGKCFEQRHYLKKHMLIHTAGATKYQCDICGKYLTSCSILASHKLIHSGVKKFSCSTCGKCFTQLGTLRRHVLIHSQ